MIDVSVTTAEAADLAHVNADVIRQWAHRGYLPVAERDQRGWPRYSRRMVLQLERARRHGWPLAGACEALSQ